MNSLQQYLAAPPTGAAARLLRGFTALAVLTVTLFIFANSAAVAEASNQTSSMVQQQIHALCDTVGKPGLKELFTVWVVRKLAHFTEYALLGLVWLLCLWAYRRRLRWAAPLCLLTAAADETVQRFTPGRSAQFSDVVLDFAGALTGLLCGLLVLCLCRMIYNFAKCHDKE